MGEMEASYTVCFVVFERFGFFDTDTTSVPGCQEMQGSAEDTL